MVLVETERLFIRQWVPDDWKRFRPLGTDPRVLEYLTTEPWSDERIQQFINKGIEVAKTRGWILWPVIHREDAELIGFCGFGDGFPPDVEIGWRLLPEYWGRGLATEAAKAVMQYGFETFRFNRLISVTHHANRRSIRVMEKLGMTFEKSFTYKETQVVCYAKTNPSGAARGYREDLAYIHDAGFGDLARSAASFLIDELHRSAMDHGLVIDLGCGSGILSEHLAAGGYDVMGIDLSAALIELARKSVPSGQFRVESLLTAELPPCIAVAAVGECVNYLFDDRHSLAGVRQVLARAFAALVPGGLLLFDVSEPGRASGSASKAHREGEDWAVLVAIEEDEQQQLLTRHITSFRKVGESYRRDHEVHRLRLLPRAQVLSWLRDIGFQVKTLDAYGSTPFAAGHVGFLA